MKLPLLLSVAGIHLVCGTYAKDIDHLNLTTIAIANNVSVFQCWQLYSAITHTLFNAGPVNITSLGPLGDPVNATWMSAPAGTVVPQHNASAVEYNVVLSGTLLLNSTETGQSAVIRGGAHGIILVTDTMGPGHASAISPEGPAVVMMLPIKDGTVPEHIVLHEGQCLEDEMNY